MLKRLVGVICVRNGWVVQSIGYNRYLPVGRPEIVAENLDRWLLDEILVLCIDRTAQGLGPDFDTLERIGSKGLMTPLAFGGGISSAEQALRAVKLGADRLCIEHVFNTNPQVAEEICEAVGVQAMIRALPLEIGPKGEVLAYNYLQKNTHIFDPESLATGYGAVFSEVLLIDRKGDGGLASFDTRLFAPFAQLSHQLIAFGGITTKPQVQTILEQPMVSAVAVGNSLSYRELANLDLLDKSLMHNTRKISHGEQSQGARQW